jgi:hypothetical protein
MTRKRQYAAEQPDIILAERRQHGRVTRDTEQSADTQGAIGQPYRAESLLERLQRVGDIGARERAAGEEFQRLFRLAWLDPLRAASLDEVFRGASRLPHGSEDARRRVNEVFERLGSRENSRAASCAWYVIGCEQSLATWSRNMRWMGRTMSEHAAKGVLLATLDMLVAHFERRPKKSA